MEKNELINYSTTVVSKDKKARDVLKVYLKKPEDIANFKAEFAKAEALGNGIRITFHTEDKQYDGRTFKSTFGFVGSIQARPPTGADAGGRTAVPIPAPAAAAPLPAPAAAPLAAPVAAPAAPAVPVATNVNTKVV